MSIDCHIMSVSAHDVDATSGVRASRFGESAGCDEAVWTRWRVSAMDAGVAEEMVVRTEHEQVSREAVRQRLSEQSVKPWQRKSRSVAPRRKARNRPVV